MTDNTMNWRYLSCWKKQTKPQQEPINSVETKVSNPLVLQHHENILTHELIKVHYEIEKSKREVAREFQRGSSFRAKQALAKRLLLSEKKRLFELRLKNVQTSLATHQT